MLKAVFRARFPRLGADPASVIWRRSLGWQLGLPRPIFDMLSVAAHTWPQYRYTGEIVKIQNSARAHSQASSTDRVGFDAYSSCPSSPPSPCFFRGGGWSSPAGI